MNRHKKLVIAIDGASGVGKSSLAEFVAEQINAFHLNSGMLYRIIAYRLAENGGDISLSSFSDKDAKLAIRLANELTLEDYIHIKNRDDSGEINLHDKALSSAATTLYTMPEVRTAIRNLQRKIMEHPEGIVIEGRDIARAVAPDADLKILVTAAADIAYARRSAQGIEETSDAEGLRERDVRNQQVSGTTTGREEGVIIIDTSTLSEESVRAQVMQLVQDKMLNLRGHTR